MATQEQKPVAESSSRIIEVLKSGDSYCDNKIVTSHYTLANFIPKNGYEQFQKPANVYFLFLSILQTLPKVTTTGNIPTILLPLLFVLVMNALKDAIEDYRRHVADREENERVSLAVNTPQDGKSANNALEKTKWCNIQVGSIVVVRANEFVPADLVIIRSAHEEGFVYIETANLDGETNLKTKQAPQDLLKLVGGGQTAETAAGKAAQLEGRIECEQPNEFLYTFAGNVSLTGKKVSLDEQHVVLRGCKVKNVDWCIGYVVYTGRQTKIMMNSKEKQGRKVSHLEKDVGKLTILIFILQVLLCLSAAIVGSIFESLPASKAKTYLPFTDTSGNSMNGFLIFLIRFCTYLVLFSNFIPISLLVSMSLVKLVQVLFFYSDKRMIFQDIHCMPRTSDLNEELGQIEYVFSDKTGTLTCNVMDFRKFCVNGKTYGQGLTEIRRQVLLKMGKPVPEPPPVPPGIKTTPHVDLADEKLEELLTKRVGPEYQAVREFLLHLAINHEVVVEFDSKGGIGYSASSPDESALCYGAHHFGFSYRARESDTVTVQLNNNTVKVKILAIMKFNSARKRSSVIASFQDRDEQGKQYDRLVLYTKGADSVILERLDPKFKGTTAITATMETLKEFAEDGLRTLCLAGRDLTQQEVDTFLHKFHEANCATEHRQDKLDAVAEEIEKNLTMHGITGIEDRLQDEVSNTIVSLQRANVKVWMLTGDKIETAINIGIATGLLEAEVKEQQRPIFSIGEFEDGGEYKPEHCAAKLKTVAKEARDFHREGKMFEGMVIDGKCLETALEAEYEKEFVAISRVCRTCICCRVTPKQKGAVVRLIKAEEQAITLAIGDGANDCNMIQSADVGIGIRGLEGLQAFNVSDYGISQFRSLQDLTLVHGRWSYRRSSTLANYMFYKNIVVVMPQYFLGCVSFFSGQKLFNDILYQSYNVVHTMLPIMIFAVIDQDVSRNVSLNHPELYEAGPKREYMNRKLAVGWILTGLWHAFTAFFIPYYAMSNGNVTNADGKANDLWTLGTCVYLIVVINTNVSVLLETYYLTWMTWFGVGFSAFFWFAEQGYMSGLFIKGVVDSQQHGTLQRLFSMPMFYLIIVASVSGALILDLNVKGIRCSFFPTTLHRVQGKVLEDRAKWQGSR